MSNRRCPNLRRLFILGLWIAQATPGAAWAQQAPGLPPAPEAPSAPQAPGFSGAPDGSQAGAGGMPSAPDGFDRPEDNLLASNSTPAAQDPPGRAGRVQVLAGRASLRPQGQSEWVDAASNRPVTAGDDLWVDAEGRAMVQLGSSTVFLDSNTAITITSIDTDTLQLGLNAGTVLLHVGSVAKNALVEVDVQGLSAVLERPGDYLISKNQQGAEAVTVRTGEAEVRIGTDHIAVREGQKLAHARPATPVRTLTPAGPADGFEQVCLSVDQKSSTLPALHYVSEDMVGYQDLDAHGTWSPTTEYGTVWAPSNVASNWAPYRFGHWAFVLPWGWTWVDDAPWGFAPFHYGRWVFWQNAWAWAPGPYRHRPLYAPHLVTFLGAQGGVGVSAGIGIGGGSVAWIPLGYNDPFMPGYAASYVYLRNINGGFVSVTHVGGRRSGYANFGVPGAITAVPLNAWSGGLAIGGVYLSVGAGAYSPRAFGAPLPPVGRPGNPYRPAGARAGVRPPAGIMASPRGYGRPLLGTIHYGSAPGGRAGSPLILPSRPLVGASLRVNSYNQQRSMTQFTRPQAGGFEPHAYGHMVQPSVGHPGFGGHMGAPAYYGGGGHGGGGGGGYHGGGGGGHR